MSSKGILFAKRSPHFWRWQRAYCHAFAIWLLPPYCIGDLPSPAYLAQADSCAPTINETTAARLGPIAMRVEHTATQKLARKET
eukprot:6192103-Pleurochrysis_carterae.AAC.3